MQELEFVCNLCLIVTLACLMVIVVLGTALIVSHIVWKAAHFISDSTYVIRCVRNGRSPNWLLRRLDIDDERGED